MADPFVDRNQVSFILDGVYSELQHVFSYEDADEEVQQIYDVTMPMLLSNDTIEVQS